MRITTIATLAALLCGGCARGPKLPFVQSAKEAVGLDRIFQNDYDDLASKHQQRQIVTPDSKDVPFWKRPLGVTEPRVVRRNDPVRLNTSPQTVLPEVHIEAARLHEQRGDLASAANAYGRALQADADNELALLSFARLYDRNNSFDDAIKLYRRAADAHPASARTHNDYGLCLVRHGDVSQGLQQLTKAVELAPQEARYRNNIGQVLVSAGRIEDALSHLRAVHSGGVAHYNVGYWLQQEGNQTAAMPHFVRAAELEPELDAARQMVAQLQTRAVPQTAAAAPQTAPYGGYHGPLYGAETR